MEDSIMEDGKQVVKIKSERGRIPRYQTEGSSGLDLEASLESPLRIKPMERALVPTGIYIELPRGFEAQVRARSGLSIKHGITMVNGIGTVDSDYRGELKVPIINLGQEEFVIEDGMRIAQMVITKYQKVDFELVECLEYTERGAGGFGHSGLTGCLLTCIVPMKSNDNAD